jgi:hypothetical protein
MELYCLNQAVRNARFRACPEEIAGELRRSCTPKHILDENEAVSVGWIDLAELEDLRVERLETSSIYENRLVACRGGLPESS